jgi:hypothetical protein
MKPSSIKSLLALVVILLGGNLAYQAGLISPAAAASPPQVQEVVRAKLIELVAPDGKVVGQLHTSEDGSANLRLRSGSGEVRVKLGASKNGSGLVLLNNNTEPGVTLYAQDDGGAATIAEDGKSKRVVAE